MLLAVHALALFVAVMMFLWMIVLHRRVRAAAELVTRPMVAPTFVTAFASRPPLWLAVRAADPRSVQSALGLNRPTP